MKIAVASEKGEVTKHFGFCETFDIFVVEGMEILNVQSIPNPGHRPGFLPKFLKNKGVDVIISGGMGSNAANIFKANGIDTVIGVTGNNYGVVEDYIKGNLQSSIEPCNK